MGCMGKAIRENPVCFNAIVTCYTLLHQPRFGGFFFACVFVACGMCAPSETRELAIDDIPTR